MSSAVDHTTATNSRPFRLLHVHAHPDDESSKGAASTARYVDEGVDVMVATCTGGERGSILNPKMDRPDVRENLSEIRKSEMARAQQVLGVHHTWLGFVDSGLPDAPHGEELPEGCFGLQDPAVAAGELVRVIREFKPHVVTTYDERGGYPHPDHIMCHKVTVEAVKQAADPTAWPEYGEPWQVSKLYYDMTLNKPKLTALSSELSQLGIESPFAQFLDSWPGVDDPERITTKVRCDEYFEVRNDALRAHETQVDPEGMWFVFPLEMERRVWPTEDYQLVWSTVDSPLPEDDLFAGLIPEQG